MVNAKEKSGSTPSTKARLVEVLRAGNGRSISGGKLAVDLGISRVAVWKGIQSLVKAGYSVDTLESGYSLDPESPSDFLYPGNSAKTSPCSDISKTPAAPWTECGNTPLKETHPEPW